MPVCSGSGAGMVYFVFKDSLYRMNPNSPSTASFTGIMMPFNAFDTARALAVSRNINGGTPALTYYTTLTNGTTRYLYYWNGTNWVTTNDVLNSDHIGGGGGFIYSYQPATGLVFQYDGSSLANFLLPSGGVEDIAADCDGNFYILYLNATTPVLRMWDAAGTLQNTYTLSGTFTTTGGQGLAVNGNLVHYNGDDGKLYTGVISGTNVNFSASTSNPFTALPPRDFGSCGYAGYDGDAGATDTINFCGSANNYVLTATGPGPYDWTVIDGPATITGSGSSVIVNATATSVITRKDANCAGVNAIEDTTVIFVVTGTFDAGPDRTIFTCGQPVIDSIQATLTNTVSSVLYAPSWTPLSVILAGTNTTLTPIFQINKTTTFYGEVATRGNCFLRDTIKITIVDSTPVADYQYLYRYGCEQDTVCFFNTSRGGIDSFAWFFRDSAGNNGNFYYTDAIAPCHIFKDQGFYPVRLLAKNKFCEDTVTKLINVSHPLIPEFAIDDSAACVDHLFVFDDKSITPSSNPAWPNPAVSYRYDFGDGTTSTLANPTHTFPRAGTYTVTLTLTDLKLGCKASVSHVVIVDTLPFVRVVSADTAICQGQAVTIKADYLTIGNTGIAFDMGDGEAFNNKGDVTYTYVNPGNYNVRLIANYRYCPADTAFLPVTVRPFPGVNIGQDTVLCPNGSPIILSDRANLGNTAASYLWNTGERTPSIAARNIGTYWARVNIGNCTATDSIFIYKDCYVDIPNSFTPNGDGTNDYYLPRQLLSRSISEFKMIIFNRWGQKVFESATLNGRGWDGKFNGQDQPQGVYVYQIDVSFDNGAKEHYTGNLTLLR